MNNLYISHSSLYAPTNSFWILGSMLISRFLVTSWFYSVFNSVTLEKKNHINMNYNYPTTIWESIVAQMYKFLVEFFFSQIFAYTLFMVKIEKNVNNTSKTYICVKIRSHILVGICLHDKIASFVYIGKFSYK